MEHLDKKKEIEIMLECCCKKFKESYIARGCQKCSYGEHKIFCDALFKVISLYYINCENNESK